MYFSYLKKVTTYKQFKCTFYYYCFNNAVLEVSFQKKSPAFTVITFLNKLFKIKYKIPVSNFIQTRIKYVPFPFQSNVV